MNDKDSKTPKDWGAQCLHEIKSNNIDAIK